MKEYIVLTLNANNVIFDYRKVENDEKQFINKNSIYKNSFYYDIKHYKKNIKSICALLQKNSQVQLNTLTINRLITFKYAFDLEEIFHMQMLKLNFMSTIDIEDYELFLTSPSLKVIECYFMPSTYIEKFTNKGVVIQEFCSKKLSPNFMEQQDVSSEDSLYYIKTINIKSEYEGLIDDLSLFLKINYKLKGIHLHVFSKELITKIVELLEGDESRNVIIFLHQGSDKGSFIINNFAWLKGVSDNAKEKYICDFRIVYSSSFLKNNLFKQLSFNNLKMITIVGIYISIVCIILVKSYEYIERMNVDNLANDVITETYGATNNTQNETETNDTVVQEETPATADDGRYKLEKSFQTLTALNSETVGFLTLQNTEIRYPVVQHSDNSYYLMRDFYGNKASMGWIYLDYRNRSKDLDDNSIIYGHNMSNGSMFGTLKKVLSSSWRANKDNMIISYDTPTKSYKFEIFAAYKVDYTTDYLITSFDSTEEKQKFIDKIIGRSTFKTNVKVTTDDKLLTLSTCTGSGNSRLAVHAVLIEE